jgi:hypothetical protein
MHADLHSRGPSFSHCVKANPSCGCVMTMQGGGASLVDGGGKQNNGAALKFAGGRGGGAEALPPAASAASHNCSNNSTRGIVGSIVDPAPGDATAAVTPCDSIHWCITLPDISDCGGKSCCCSWRRRWNRRCQMLFWVCTCSPPSPGQTRPKGLAQMRRTRRRQ